ncbi:MAG: hypothetical protein ACOYZ7_01195 [Chloroflexota bacterium]
MWQLGFRRGQADRRLGIEPLITALTSSLPGYAEGYRAGYEAALEIEPHFAEEARKRQDAGRVAGGHARHGDVEHGGKSPTKQKSRDQAAASTKTT